jgi:hypothetical protein
MKRLQDHIGTALSDTGYIDKDIVGQEFAEEVTGGVTNYVARLPEVAENSQSWLASVQDKPLLEAPSTVH